MTNSSVSLSQLELLQQVLDLLPQHIFWKDRESRFLGCNKAFAQLNGFAEPLDLVGKNDYSLPCTPEEADFFRECDRKVMESNQPEYHIIEPLVTADGKQRWVDTTKVPLHDDHGTVIGILGTFEDVTERVEAERALIEKSEHFENLALEREAELVTLKKIVPICSYCKEIRDESGQWRPVETYLKARSDDDFSHSFCDKCLQKHFGDI